MVHVVVAVGPIAANGLQVFESVKITANDFKVTPVPLIVDRIGFGLPDDKPIHNLMTTGKPQFFELMGGRVYDRFVWSVPECVPCIAEVFHPDIGLATIGNHLRAPILEILDAPHDHIRIVDINPLFRKKIFPVQDQANHHKGPIRQVFSGCQYFNRGYRFQGAKQIGNRYT